MNKKKIIKIGIPVAAGCIVLALGIGFAVKNSGKAVKVAPVSGLNSGGWYDDSGIASYGTVTTNQKQDIYVDDTMPITQVYVKAGDTVTILGRDGMETISAEEVAEKCGTITNELLARRGPRLPLIPVEA